jgi:hypothetical protein
MVRERGINYSRSEGESGKSLEREKKFCCGEAR